MPNTDFRLDAQGFAHSIGLPAIVLDRKLEVRLVTSAAAALFNLDGLRLNQYASKANVFVSHAFLADDARSVLARGHAVQRVVSCPSGDHALRCSQPYKPYGGAVEGVVVTFAKRVVRNLDVSSDVNAFSEPDRVSMDARNSVLLSLTNRQREILSLVLAGHPSKRIATLLGISTRTVENHRASIMQRTGCRSLPDLTRLALQFQLGRETLVPQASSCANRSPRTMASYRSAAAADPGAAAAFDCSG